MPARTLSYLECIKVHSQGTRNYIAKRATEVQRWIDRLTAFAKLKPNSKPGLHCARTAKQLQFRLNKILSHQAPRRPKGENSV